MEVVISVLLPVLAGTALLRALAGPVRFAFRAALRCVGGFACLWAVNLSAGITGITLPVNAVTVLVAGFLGLPGVGLVALLEIL